MNKEEVKQKSDITRQALVEVGIDPDKFCKLKVFEPMVKKLLLGEWTLIQFQNNSKKIAIINKSILLK